jgi:hypothetical protein
MQTNEAKINSFETFLNYSNPLGQAYSLKPGRSLIYLQINYGSILCSSDLKEYHQSLESYNYAPVPFLEFGKRHFITLTKLANGDHFEGQMNAEGKRDGFGYALIDSSSAIFEGYW